MGASKTLARQMLWLALWALVLPITLFVFFNQVRIWQMVNQTLESDIENEVQMGNMMLDLILEKYSTVLYDFCTDDTLVELVERINDNQDELDVNQSQLRRKLSHICNRNEGVEGITLVTCDGKRFFYDRGESSSIRTTWADHVLVPEVQSGTVYRGGIHVILEDSGNGCLFQIARRIVDYGNLDREIGTVILSINQNVLWRSIQTKQGSLLFISDGERVIAAENRELIDCRVDEIVTRGRKVRSVENASSGWVFHDFYSMAGYQEAIRYHFAVWIGFALVMVAVVGMILRRALKPLLRKVQELEGAMSRVQEGDFSVQIASDGITSRELCRIIDGFNNMVSETGALLEQVRVSMTAQKNAELSAMEAQIDPHFLYNTLDTINWKAIELGEFEISNMVGALADILRYSIRNLGDMVSIRQELSWLQQYVMLQKEKLNPELEVQVDVPDYLGGYRIHKLLLQPFLENAINHGFYGKKDTCILKIRMRLAENQIHIVISDNGCGMPTELLRQLNSGQEIRKGHLGISNVRKRLSLYYGENQDIYFESSQEMGTTVHLFIEAVTEKEQNSQAAYGEGEKREDSSGRG